MMISLHIGSARYEDRLVCVCSLRGRAGWAVVVVLAPERAGSAVAPCCRSSLRFSSYFFSLARCFCIARLRDLFMAYPSCWCGLSPEGGGYQMSSGLFSNAEADSYFTSAKGMG